LAESNRSSSAVVASNLFSWSRKINTPFFISDLSAYGSIDQRSCAPSSTYLYSRPPQISPLLCSIGGIFRFPCCWNPFPNILRQRPPLECGPSVPCSWKAFFFPWGPITRQRFFPLFFFSLAALAYLFSLVLSLPDRFLIFVSLFFFCTVHSRKIGFFFS